MNPPAIRHEIEDRPIRAEAEQVRLRGWCAQPGQSTPPAVRLRVGETLLPATGRFPRPDVAGTLGLPADGTYGFDISGTLPPGVHLAVLEAEQGEAWRAVRRFTVAVAPAPLAGQIEQPAVSPLRESLRVQGWCAHPRHSLRRVELSFGNIRLPCEWGLPRRDVPALVPTSPDGARAGFISSKNLPASRGPLRVRAEAEDGSVHFLHPGLAIDIEHDADRAAPLRLGDHPAASLGPARRPPAASDRRPSSPPLRVLFVLYGDFTSNSAIHVMNLARELTRRGHTCTVAVPHHAETAAYFPETGIRTGDFATLAGETSGYDLAHAWTTRENVRRFCTDLQAQGRIGRLCVHLEDNELRILESSTGRTLAELAALPDAELDHLVPATLSHPRRSRDFLRAADGVTVIIDTLRAHVPSGPAVHPLSPAADDRVFFPRERPVAFRRALGWEDDRVILLYHGNTHAANRAEVLELYRAVHALNADGIPCTLLRLGRDDPAFTAARPAGREDHVIELGQVRHHHHLGMLLALADVFVQPGESDAFNDYRLPSKLPEFFALGRPVVLPRTNLGRVTRHGEEAYVLDRADAGGIARAIRELRDSPGLAARLARGALAFAAEHFDWGKSAGRLEDFYRAILLPR